VRSGAQTLALLAAPLNVALLEALAEGPKQQGELRHAAGLPAQTTLRAQLKRLVEVGAVEKHRRDSFPGTLVYELTRSGQDLLFVLNALERWLESAPDRSVQIGGNAGKAAIKALAEGWSTTMVRALAAGALSLTELDRVISSLSYPSLERRLSAMRLAGLIESRPSNGRGNPYAVTDRMRYGIAPLMAAARWERRHQASSTAPLGGIDVEAVLLLAAPLLQVPEGTSGSCRIATQIANGDAGRLAGATITLEGGRLASCTTKLGGDPDAWALGSPTAWLAAMIERDADGFELGGDSGFARALLNALHGSLFKELLQPH
jgi:DNA-binding HxlR family transcriptional regulator